MTTLHAKVPNETKAGLIDELEFTGWRIEQAKKNSRSSELQFATTNALRWIERAIANTRQGVVNSIPGDIIMVREYIADGLAATESRDAVAELVGALDSLKGARHQAQEIRALYGTRES